MFKIIPLKFEPYSVAPLKFMMTSFFFYIKQQKKKKSKKR